MQSEFIDDDVVAERFDRLKEVLNRSALEKHQARVGNIEEVLVEGPSRRNDQVMSGRTRQGKLVHFPVTSEPVRAGSLVTVKLQKAAPYHLKGELDTVIRAAKHKVRIPLNIS